MIEPSRARRPTDQTVNSQITFGRTLFVHKAIEATNVDGVTFCIMIILLGRLPGIIL